MKLKIYKGFNVDFYNGLNEIPLVDLNIYNRINVLEYSKKFNRILDAALINMDDNDIRWITYEEFTLIKDSIETFIDKYNLDVEIVTNNIFPDIYPLNIEIKEDLYNKYLEYNMRLDSLPEELYNLSEIFSNISLINNIYYISYYNFEYENKKFKISNYYSESIILENVPYPNNYERLFINDDLETYINDIEKIIQNKTKNILIKSSNGEVSKKIQRSFLSLAFINNINVYKDIEEINTYNVNEEELREIGEKILRIPNFKFRDIKFYKNPDMSKEVINISQLTIISELIKQSERSMDINQNFRDIFVTASTGAGKSVMFQIPAIYLANKYQKLTIVIQPVVALMEDQIEHLKSVGFNRAAALNSLVATQNEKEQIIKKIKNGEIDILYLSPETLLSYSLETLIGDREVGLLIIDEAHIVTTWGAGFRPDYWYLGGFINSLRNRIKSGNNKNKKIQRFPICAFTATAINGGVDDTINETIISLYMENPIKYVGYVIRDNIDFDIKIVNDSKTINRNDYERQKGFLIKDHVNEWISKNEKTILYFPYASTLEEAYKGIKNFTNCRINSDKIGVFTGKNISGLSPHELALNKKNTLEKFKNGTQSIMYATKAFGMGVDVDDVKNVYHYAVTGNLSDYVQEIGRAARNKNLKGLAITDFFYNDINHMKQLFGMSQIRQYQIMNVMSGIYNVYKNKKELYKKDMRSFLISPQSFTYIFTNKGSLANEDSCINKLKTCLLMLEKDFYDKYNFKVIVSRPQSVFTKGYICIKDEYKEEVLNSKFGKHFTFVTKGRHGEFINDMGDIYSIDLKSIWERFYPDISFPSFKYCYFNSKQKDFKKKIMPEIIDYIYPRQKIVINTKDDLILSDLQNKIFEDFDYISDKLYSEFSKEYFTIDEFVFAISEKYGKTKSKVIANSLFELVDSRGKCIKSRKDSNLNVSYQLSNGTLAYLMRLPITKSPLINSFFKCSNTKFEKYLSTESDSFDFISLKLLSLFNYISYEVSGGEEPEIFIRLNDPEKFRRIINNEVFYQNDYVIRAKNKHNRDVQILLDFFTKLNNSKERWEYIENYFLGYNLLSDAQNDISQKVSLIKLIDKEKSYNLGKTTWNDLKMYIDDKYHFIINDFIRLGLQTPDYLNVNFKKNINLPNAMMCWSDKNVIIFNSDVTDKEIEFSKAKGWFVFVNTEIDLEKLSEVLQ